jgi:hypothetical protein
MNTNQLYCKVFVDSDQSSHWLEQLVAAGSGGQPAPHGTVVASDFEADVRKNDDFDAERRRAGDDSFLYFRYYLDVVPKDGANKTRYISAVSSLLGSLRDSGCRAVAACDFEDKL